MFKPDGLKTTYMTSAVGYAFFRLSCTFSFVDGKAVQPPSLWDSKSTGEACSRIHDLDQFELLLFRIR